MKIDSARALGLAARLKKLDAYACCREGSKMLVAYAEAIEQHHKDLMGLVEVWRREAVEWGREGAMYITPCADQLESLINPKE